MKKIVVSILMVGLLVMGGQFFYQYQSTHAPDNSSAAVTVNEEPSASTTPATTENQMASCLYQDGTYTGIGNGKTTGMQVSVTIVGDKIAQICVVASRDDEEYLVDAQNRLIPQIITAQSTAVDTVSGATRSSIGIIQGVDDALSQARVQ